jgi:DNA-binding transcriptional LysR family regulator
MTLNEKRRETHGNVHNACMIDPRLRVLRLFAAHGTVTATAEALHYTPSAVSSQLRTLAEDLGAVLLEPEGRGLRLTPAGHTLLSRCDDLYAQWEEIRSAVAASTQERSGWLRVCGFSTAAAALLPQVAADLARRHPNVTVRIIEADPEECFELLLADHVDLAVVVATADLPASRDPRFDQRHLLDDPLDLLLPERHPLARRSSVLLGEAADEPWILDRPGRPHHRLVLTACAEAGFTPAVAHEAAEWDTGAALVGAGLGVALAPRLARLPSGYPVVRVPLRGDPSPARHIVTATRRGRRGHPLVARALRVLDDAARDE